MLKSNRTKKLLEQHILYFLEVLDQQYVEAVHSKDGLRINEIECKIAQLYIELECLGS
jgi:hypothetical protein